MDIILFIFFGTIVLFLINVQPKNFDEEMNKLVGIIAGIFVISVMIYSFIKKIKSYIKVENGILEIKTPKNEFFKEKINRIRKITINKDSEMVKSYKQDVEVKYYNLIIDLENEERTIRLYRYKKKDIEKLLEIIKENDNTIIFDINLKIKK